MTELDPRLRCVCPYVFEFVLPDVACHTRATQEDRLCDVCRVGCNVVVADRAAVDGYVNQRHARVSVVHVSVDDVDA